MVSLFQGLPLINHGVEYKDEKMYHIYLPCKRLENFISINFAFILNTLHCDKLLKTERLKDNLFVAHPRWFIYRSITSHQTELQQVAKFCDHFNPKFETYRTWNWHTESTTNIQLIAFLSAVVYASSLICWFSSLLVISTSEIIS